MNFIYFYSVFWLLCPYRPFGLAPISLSIAIIIITRPFPEARLLALYCHAFGLTRSICVII